MFFLHGNLCKILVFDFICGPEPGARNISEETDESSTLYTRDLSVKHSFDFRGRRRESAHFNYFKSRRSSMIGSDGTSIGVL